MPDARPLTELVAAMIPRITGVVERVAQRTKAELPVYAPISELEIRDGIARDLGTAMSALIDGRELTDDERAGMGLIGDTRARQGLPLEAMLRVYRLTVDEVFATLFDAREQGELSHDEILIMMRQAWRTFDTASEVAVAAYRHRELLATIADTERRSALLHALLFQPGGATDRMIVDAGIDPTARYVALRARPATRDLLLTLGTPGVLDGGVVTAHGDDVVGFAPDGPRLVLADAVVGVGPPGPLAALPRSFAVATRVVDTAEAAGRMGVLRIADLALEAVARAEDVLGDALVAHYVTPLGPEVLDAVRAYVGNELSVDRAAEALGVHPNTVRNRLQRYEQTTGASVRSVDDLLRARLALLRAELG